MARRSGLIARYAKGHCFDLNQAMIAEVILDRLIKLREVDGIALGLMIQVRYVGSQVAEFYREM